MTDIIKTSLTPQLKEYIYQQFSRHSIASLGFNGLSGEPVAFEIRANEELQGVCTVQHAWGGLHIKYLVVDEKYRGQGIGRRLMEHALEYGKALGCSLAFVETMSFQAPEFYLKLGFKVDLKREGYTGGTSFYYLSRGL